MNRYVIFLCCLIYCSLISQLFGDRYDPSNWVPPEIPGASLLARQEFLSSSRSWERIDVWVPEGVDKSMPCIVLFYGGGYGGKVTGGFREHITQFIARGYVVAMPDYILGAAQPEPQVFWDGAAAIHWLRSNADRLKIDKERIGAWGFSAGGWLLQGMAPADDRMLWPIRRVNPKNRNSHVQAGKIPSLDPRLCARAPCLRLQGVASDWGVGKFKNITLMVGYLGSEDPPVFSCHNDPSGEPSEGLIAYRDAGAPIQWVTLETKNTHVPSGKTIGQMPDGSRTTWADSVYDFFDRTVKNPTRCTAPEIYPAGGPIAQGEKVRIVSVHGVDSIRYTVDGSKPTARSEKVKGPISILPGQTLRAIAVEEGLAPSGICSATFTAGKSAPRIMEQDDITVPVGKPISILMKADREVRWNICGQIRTEKEEWLSIDPLSGVICGIPPAEGRHTVIVVAFAGEENSLRWDAVQLTIIIE